MVYNYELIREIIYERIDEMEFLKILLPIFGIFFIGFVGQKTLKFDIQNISKLALYLMSPFLAFCTFYEKELSMSYLYYGIFAFLLCICIILLVFLASYILKYSVEERCAMILASAFMNNGNYGTPVILLVFGTAGMEVAVPLIVFQQMVMSTLGIYFAARGSSDGVGKNVVLEKVLKMPVVHGALLGIAFQLLHISIPNELLTCMQMVGNASIPTVMIILGMQLAVISLKDFNVSKISLAIILRLIISPIIAVIITLFLPFDVMTKQILIILAAMPTAANTTLMAVQFNTNPSLVSSATFISTSLSIITLPVLLNILPI